jgi:hypothetical protein
MRVTLNNTRAGVRYVVVAYRALEEWELLGAVQAWLDARRRWPKRGSKVTIISVLGARD